MSVLQKNKVTKIRSSYVLEQERKEKRAMRRRRMAIIRFTLLSGILLAISSALLYTLISQSANIEAKIEEEQKLEQQLEKLKKEEQQLKEEIKKLNDDEYIAELARKNYFLSKEGEIIFSVPEE
ncbi:cell division protein DivIC [Anoxybacillus vitaminiphilus]|uniref:Cell division protein DivIC n=1 Tax=Paranoxybacillus vitaminiphilus TaxID=581036 RepID=A0A327Y8Q3_9BACL|nr:septum formation initiator family protein [Anoxybacillus vitaminiphilus]RAK16552.1 cell division protein DivIC [Anoxybacillus vitaminiphilus]